MADTVRSESAIKTLFADNPTGEISEQDLRDFAETLFRAQTLLPAVQRGAVADNSTDCSAAIAEAIEEVVTDRKYAGVLLPPGQVRISETIEVPESCALDGYGTGEAGNHPGTNLLPHDNFGGSPTPPAIKTIVSAAGYWHHGKITNIQVRQFPGDGIEIEGLGEMSIVDRVFAIANGGNGFKVTGHGVPCMMGRLGAHGNGLAGLLLDNQIFTHLQIVYLGGDNNDVLMRVDTGGPQQSIQLLSWKSERWDNAGNVGHENIFDLINGNGGFVDLGQGNVNCTVASDGAVVRKSGAHSVRFCYSHRGTQNYTHGYNDVTNSETFTYAELQRRLVDTRPERQYGNRFGADLYLHNKLVGFRDPTITTIAGTTFTPDADDSGKVLRFTNGSAITVPLPNDLSRDWWCEVIQDGAGQITFSAAQGATLTNRQSHTKTAGQNAVCKLRVKANSDDASAAYVLSGDTAA